jgi:hypothetical protein
MVVVYVESTGIQLNESRTSIVLQDYATSVDVDYVHIETHYHFLSPNMPVAEYKEV